MSRTGYSHRRDLRTTLRLAWPLILSNIAPLLFSINSLSLIGEISALDLAAAALAYGLFNLSLSLFGGFDAACLAVISGVSGHSQQARQHIRTTLQQALWIVAASAAILWSIMWHLEPLLMIAKQDPIIARKTASLMRVLMLALPFYMVFQLLRSFLSAQGKGHWALLAVIIGGFSHLLLGWGIISGGFGWTIAGPRYAGLVTLTASVLMMASLCLLIQWDKHLRQFRLLQSIWHIDWRKLYELIRLGIPITLMLSFESAIFYAAMIAMGSFGADQLAAHSVAMQIVSSAFKVPFGLGQAATIQIAQAVAQNDINQARRAGWTAYLCALVFAGSTAALMLFWPTALIGFFLALDDPANAQTIRIAKSFLVLAGLFQLVDAAQAVSSGVLRGFKDAVVPMMLAGIGYWVLGLPIGLILAFAFDMQGMGIWTGLFLGLGLVAVFLTLRWIKLIRRAQPCL